MAKCENENCNKVGLRKADVEFDDVSLKILCHGCYALMHPGWMPPNEIVDLTQPQPTVPKVGFAIQMTEDDGFRASLSYGGVSLSLHAPSSEIRKLLG